MQVMEDERIWAYETLKKQKITNIRELGKSSFLEILRSSAVPFLGKERLIDYLSKQPDFVIDLFLEDLFEADHLE